jgi:hypothetical protein
VSCPHGEHESYCIDCLEGVPATVAPNVLKGSAMRSAAQYEGVCARKGCAIALGDPVVYAEGVGWCCTACAAL